MVQNEKQGYLKLIKQANDIFQKSYPDSILFTAVGRPISGVAKRADELKNWVFKAQTNKTGNSIAQLDYSGGEFGKLTITHNLVGLEYKPLPQGTIRLPAAIKILNSNGYTQGFLNVGLGTPVYKNPQPMFWFCVDEQTQGVSASTGDFFSNLFSCSAGGNVGSMKRVTPYASS